MWRWPYRPPWTTWARVRLKAQRAVHVCAGCWPCMADGRSPAPRAPTWLVPAPHPGRAAPAGLGPVFVAFFIQRLGRTGAFNLSTAGWIPCGLLLMGTGARARSSRAGRPTPCLLGLLGPRYLPSAQPPLPEAVLARGQLLEAQCLALAPCTVPTCLASHRPGCPCPPAAFTLARDEDAMQHRLRKVLSSYTFSSSALQALDDAPDEEQRLQRGPYSDHVQQPPGLPPVAPAAARQAGHEPLNGARQDGGSSANGSGPQGGISGRF